MHALIAGDDFACWPRAQVNLLHTLANASGCTVLLVGDIGPVRMLGSWH